MKPRSRRVVRNWPTSLANHLAVGRIDLGRLGKIAQPEPRVHCQHQLLQYQAGLHTENGRTQILPQGEATTLVKPSVRPSMRARSMSA